MMTKNSQLQEHHGLLDIIDGLRSQGVTKYVALPEIVVCGDQSSGKSSVLEAISGMSFPSQDGVCTRFATELILRRRSDPPGATSCRVSITPHPDRLEAEKERLRGFSPEVGTSALDLGAVIKSAKAEMGLSDDTNKFSNDILRVELSGPDQPHLTMVDLPGLFKAGSREQSADEAETVQNMVKRYMESPRSIILAVVSAKNDFANQQVTDMTRKVDPRGVRTLGLITKPDTLHAGSSSERFFVNLAQNRDVEFRLGWHVLRNRDWPERNLTWAERNEAEERFFSTQGGPWAAVDPASLGAPKLASRLSGILGEQILRQLPSLLDDVEAGIRDCELRLAALGESRTTLAEQRRYLMRVSSAFTDLLGASIDGNYTHEFFGDAYVDENYARRLRAVAQNTLDDFAQNMRLHGQSRRITEDDSKSPSSNSETVSRGDYEDEVTQLMQRNRGRELVGTYNPLIIKDLFTSQCQPWRKWAELCRDDMIKASYKVIVAILENVAATETRQSLLQIVKARIEDNIKPFLDAKVKELLEPHLSGHPITYNHYLTDMVQEMQRERWTSGLAELVNSHSSSNPSRPGHPTISPQALIDSLSGHVEKNMKRHACSSAIDYSEAYYKVALKRVIDDVAVLAIEQCLMVPLKSILSRDMIDELEDEEIQDLAKESSQAISERIACSQKLKILKAGRDDLKRLDLHKAHWGAFSESNVDSKDGEPQRQEGGGEGTGGEASQTPTDTE